jgi:hypothetical protein
VTSLVPLRQADGSPFERALLEAGADEMPSGHSRQRARVAFTAGLATAASTSAVGAAAVGSAGTSTLALVVKWVAVGVLAGAAGAGGARTVFHSAHGRSAPAHEAGAMPSAGQPTRSTLAASATPREIEIGAAAPATLASGSRAVARLDGQTGIEHEVTLLEQARAALAAGDTARSADLLDQHRRLAVRLLAPEAELLAIELATVRGDRRQAAAAARAFLAANPHSPHAQRARSLLGLAERDHGIRSPENGP